MTPEEIPDYPEYMKPHVHRMGENLSRVDSLLDLYGYLSRLLNAHEEAVTQGKASSIERPPDPTDILRSATVLLHASLEDFVRNVAVSHLPRTDVALLKEIPLIGTGTVRAAKFTLGDLVAHYEKTVENIVDESIGEWLSHRSFNNCNDIASMLKSIGIDPTTCDAEFTTLDEMIARRHSIVHNVDRVNKSDEPGSSELNDLDENTFKAWRESVEMFMVRVIHGLQEVVKE